MPTEKVGVYRKYHGPVPTDAAGNPLPKSDWLTKRPYRWAARWYGYDGNRYSKSFKTRKEADRFAETKQADVRQGRSDPPEHCNLREFYEEHRKLWKGSMARATAIMQLAVLRDLATQVGWERDLKKIRSRDIEKFRAWRAETLRTPTVNKEVKLLRRLFTLAISRGYLLKDGNPCDGIVLAKVGEKKPAYLSPEKFELVYKQAVDVRDRAKLVVFYTTGLRREELHNLVWDDVDFDRQIVHVAQHLANGYIQGWTPKDHERREIPIPQHAIDLLLELRKSAPADCPYIFMDEERWNYYRDCVDRGEWTETQDLVNNVLRKFKTLVKRAGLALCTLHDLRRSCITNWARKMSIHVTQQLAGHADINTTRRFYLSVQEDDLKTAREAQQSLVTGLIGLPATDPKLTHSGQKRSFTKRKEFPDFTQLPPDSAVA
jgi:integrase